MDMIIDMNMIIEINKENKRGRNMSLFFKLYKQKEKHSDVEKDFQQFKAKDYDHNSPEELIPKISSPGIESLNLDFEKKEKKLFTFKPIK